MLLIQIWKDAGRPRRERYAWRIQEATVFSKPHEAVTIEQDACPSWASAADAAVRAMERHEHGPVMRGGRVPTQAEVVDAWFRRQGVEDAEEAP